MHCGGTLRRGLVKLAFQSRCLSNHFPSKRMAALSVRYTYPSALLQTIFDVLYLPQLASERRSLAFQPSFETRVCSAVAPDLLTNRSLYKC